MPSFLFVAIQMILAITMGTSLDATLRDNVHAARRKRR